MTAGPLQGRRLWLDPRPQIIGRAAPLALAADTVSLRHAEAWYDHESVWLADLGSTNGTLVNGHRIGRTPYPVAAGDRVDLGEVTLVVNRSGADPPVQAVGVTFAVNAQRGRQITNVGGNYTDGRVSHYNDVDVDINPLPRSPAGRRLIYTGLVLKALGMLMSSYWAYHWMQSIFDVAKQPMPVGPETSFEQFHPDLPPMMPWVPLGTTLFVVGMTLSITGAVVAYSTRRRNNVQQYR